jgi:hypothetical protein
MLWRGKAGFSWDLPETPKSIFSNPTPNISRLTENYSQTDTPMKKNSNPKGFEIDSNMSQVQPSQNLSDIPGRLNSSRQGTPPPFEDLKKKDFNKWYEQGKLAEWRENYIDYSTLKDKIEEMYKELVGYFTEKDDQGAAMHIPKNHPKVTGMLKDFENLLINDLANVAAFYSQEEVKVLSLTYDVMRQLKSIKVTDFSKVLNIVIQ